MTKMLTIPIGVKVRRAIEVTKQTILSSKVPFCLGYSGGKDSTVTLDITIKAMMEIAPDLRKHKVYVIYSDVMVEMPPVVSVINTQIARFEDYVKKHNLPFVFKRAQPEIKHRFYSLYFGTGYMLPRRDNKVCVDRMKLLPQKKIMIETFTKVETNESLFGDELATKKVMGSIEYIGIIGVRKAEGQDRKARIEKHAVTGAENMMELNGRLTLAPVSEWSSKDIWTYLYTQVGDWCDVEALSKIYAESSGQSDTECNTIIHGEDAAEKPACAHSGRFGCNFCTVVGNSDKALQNLTKNYDYMKPLKQFRDWLYQYTFCSWDKRDLYNHREHKALMYTLDKNHRSGMISNGGYSLGTRKRMLLKALNAESEVRTYENMSEYRMVLDEELKFIQDTWFREGDIHFTARKIAQKYNRDIAIEPHLMELSKAIKVFIKCLPARTSTYDHCDETFNWIPTGLFGSKHFERFATQLALQLQQKFEDRWREYYFALLDTESVLYHDTVAHVKKLPISQMYFPSKKEEYTLRNEHKNDKIDYLNFTTQMQNDMDADREKHGLFSEIVGTRRTPNEWFESKEASFQDLYSGYYAAFELQEKGEVQDDDWINNPLIPLKEKMQILDGWY